MLLHDVKSKYRFISRKFSGVKFFHPSLNQPKPMATPFRIRSINQSKRSTLYFLSFVVSVLFARFHFKVVRKSLYYPITSTSGKQNIKLRRPKERFHLRGEQLCKFIATQESVDRRKEFNSYRTNMAAASLRWDTIVVDMTSCKLKGSVEVLRL